MSFHFMKQAADLTSR